MCWAHLEITPPSLDRECVCVFYPVGTESVCVCVLPGGDLCRADLEFTPPLTGQRVCVSVLPGGDLSRADLGITP